MIPLIQKIIGGRQEPINIADYIATLANGASVAFESPVEGYTLLYGMVYSSQVIQVDFDEGINDRTGALNYRWNWNFNVAAGTAEKRLMPICGNFLRVTLTNNSGFPANIEANFNVRGFA